MNLRACTVGALALAAFAASHVLEANTPAASSAEEQPTSLPRSPGLKAEAKADASADSLEQAKRREILGSDDDQTQERRVIKFLQLVALPLLVCLGLILLLRRGLFGG